VNSLERFAALATFYCLVHSFLEEYYWRWFVYRRLRADMPVTAALIVSGVGFMGHHVIVLGQFFHGYGLVTWLFSAAVAVGGAAWALLYERSRSLLGIWLSHVLVDAGIMLIGWDLIFR
jgi:membrane protease YdiL (CAAX protease family)